MAWSKYVLYFVAGGLITTAIVTLEESGMTLLSRLAVLFPVVTWISYLLLGQTQPPEAIASHARFVLIGTIVSWIPYMSAIIYFSPRIGVVKAVVLAIAVFLVIALLFTYVYTNLLNLQ